MDLLAKDILWLPKVPAVCHRSHSCFDSFNTFFTFPVDVGSFYVHVQGPVTESFLKEGSETSENCKGKNFL